MRLSKESDYALRIVFYLARENRTVLSRDIIEACKIPQQFGFRIISSLVKLKILKSTPGTNGGITINKTPKEISVYDVIASIEDLTFKDCIESPEVCSWRCGKCPICNELKKVKENFIQDIKSIDFEKLLNEDLKINKVKMGGKTK